MRALFLRGLTREINHWNGLPEKFSSKTGIPVLALDLPGAGMFHQMTSPKKLDLYVEFLRAKIEKGSPLVLIGISMGGMIALRWATLYPHEVERVFIINSSASNLSSARERFNLSEWRVLLNILLTASAEKKERLILNLTTNKLNESEKEKIANFFVEVQRKHPVSIVSSLNQLWAASKFELFYPPKVPVVVIGAQGDRLVSPSCSKKLSEVLKAPLEVHPDAGHDLPLDAPDWLLSVLAKFL